MFPVEAPHELQIRIFHRLGPRQYVLTLQLQSGDGVPARVLEAFQQGRLPPCLYRPTLEYAVLAAREALADRGQPRPAPRPGPRGTGAGAGAGAGADPGDALLDLEERRWPRPLGRRGQQPSPPGRGRLLWCAFDFLLRHRPAFFRTIGTLEDSYLKGIRDLQAGRLAAISELQRCQSIEMEKKRIEAENVAQGEVEEGVFREVQSLVAQHVSEIDAIELHWRTEIEQLKTRQRASYRDLVVDFFEQEIEQLGGEHDARSAAGEPGGARGLRAPPRAPRPGDVPGGPACPLRRTPPPARPPAPPPPAASGAAPGAAPVGGEDAAAAGCVAPEEARPARGAREQRLQECAGVRAQFGKRRAFFTLRLWVGDILDLLQEPPPAAGAGGGAAWADDDADGAGPQLPPDFLGLESYGHGYFARGSGLPVKGVGWPLLPGPAVGSSAPAPTAAPPGAAPLAAAGRAVLRSPSLRFWGPPALAPPIQLSPNAYACRLRGLVVPTPENLRPEALQAVMLREFAARCDGVTDLHFPPLAEQLRMARSAARGTPLRSGDYLCTRHSNLGGTVQAAFHLLTGSSEAQSSDEVPAATHRALKRIVCDCHRSCVAELSLPLLLLDLGASESSLPYAVAQRRAENALRALKGALTRLAEELAPSETPGLQVLNLVLPPSCAQGVKPGIPTVVETTRTFLQHSFQCV